MLRWCSGLIKLGEGAEQSFVLIKYGKIRPSTMNCQLASNAVLYGMPIFNLMK